MQYTCDPKCIPALGPVGEWPRDKLAPCIVLLTGYRRTGKDTFGNDLLANSFRYNWDVYGTSADHWSDKITTDTAEYICISFKEAHKVAFADAIRKIVSDAFGLGPNYDFDANKDATTINGRLVRQHLIDVGTDGRHIDPEYWAKLAFVPFFSETDDKRKMVVCTDWRFRSEMTALVDGAHAPITTIRLFRNDVPVPDWLIQSEHDLDTMSTHILCVPHDGVSYTEACIRWPVYKSYTLVGRLDALGFDNKI
jgi:hypothetical protein